MTLLEKLNTGILEDKGVWSEIYEPSDKDITMALSEIDFVKEYNAPNGLKVYYSRICGQDSITVLRDKAKVNQVKEEAAVAKQVKMLETLEYVGNASINDLWS